MPSTFPPLSPPPASPDTPHRLLPRAPFAWYRLLGPLPLAQRSRFLLRIRPTAPPPSGRRLGAPGFPPGRPSGSPSRASLLRPQLQLLGTRGSLHLARHPPGSLPSTAPPSPPARATQRSRGARPLFPSRLPHGALLSCLLWFEFLAKVQFCQPSSPPRLLPRRCEGPFVLCTCARVVTGRGRPRRAARGGDGGPSAGEGRPAQRGERGDLGSARACKRPSRRAMDDDVRGRRAMLRCGDVVRRTSRRAVFCLPRLLAGVWTPSDAQPALASRRASGKPGRPPPPLPSAPAPTPPRRPFLARAPAPLCARPVGRCGRVARASGVVPPDALGSVRAALIMPPRLVSCVFTFCFAFARCRTLPLLRRLIFESLPLRRGARWRPV